MSTNIIVSGSLKPSTTDTPLDERTRINRLDDISSIDTPYIGLQIYNLDDGKVYIVKSLKSKVVGAITVPDAQIDQYEAVQNSNSNTSLNLNCLLNVRIPTDEDNDNLTCYVVISENADFTNSIEINSDDNSCKIIYEDNVEELTTSTIPSYAYGGLVSFDLTEIDGVDSSKVYYAKARFYDGEDYGNWASTMFLFCGYIDTGVSNNSNNTSTNIYIDEDNYWVINNENTGVKATGAVGATGEKGETGESTIGSILTIGENGNWYINDVDTGTQARGETGTVTSCIVEELPTDLSSYNDGTIFILEN